MGRERGGDRRKLDEHLDRVFEGHREATSAVPGERPPTADVVPDDTP
jgi:hypothetical protein